jgi:uncharacterized BrkB/YihY/UPF0761 family membrane protein
MIHKFFDAIGKAARSLVAFMVVISSFALLFVLVYKSVPEQNKDIIQIAAGMVLTVLGTVAAYYFGSSKDKSDHEKAVIKEKLDEIKKN